MNDIWSKHIQGAETLYYSRKLRFDDMFAGQYKPLFALDENKTLDILEIGCGPGALAGALRRWYPNARITGVDRDSEFIRFAKEHESGITFTEGDIAALPFADSSFDVVISNTVSEHIEPSIFYGEQRRVLKTGGICLVLSSRRGIADVPEYDLFDDFEQKFWEKVQKYDHSLEKYGICKYPASEEELPAIMEQYGFCHLRTGFALVDLTPDDPKFPAALAHDIINADRYGDLNKIHSVLYSMPEHFTADEVEKMVRYTNARYDVRLEHYDHGEKMWDTCVSIIMVVRGEK